MQTMLLLLSFDLSVGHFIDATPSLTLSQNAEHADTTPAPFFCMMKHDTAVKQGTNAPGNEWGSHEGTRVASGGFDRIRK